MDYAIVLIPRVKEEHDLPGDQSAAVVSGPCRTSGMIIAAACILAVVSAAIWTSRVTNIKMLGPGLLSGVPVDASAVHWC